MNYQHAFHAGSFADVHKHIVLTRILSHLRAKPAAFRVIDTHAGAGRYDLTSSEATRGAEWLGGIKRIWDATPGGQLHDFIAPYLEIVAALNSGGDLPGGSLRIYPGSPLIALHMLRPQDRLIACELEPRAAVALNALLRPDRRAKAISIDGWTALGAYVPPKERRGLVLVDPPFELDDDFTRLVNGLAAAHRKWPTGIYMLWYPITDRAAADALVRRLRKLALPRLLCSELAIRPAAADDGLTGSGLIVLNPPFQLDAELAAVLPGLARLLSPQATAQATAHVGWLTVKT